MNNFIILSEKKWHQSLFEKLKDEFPLDNWFLIDSKENFNEFILEEINPLKVFIPHWSHYIPKKIYCNYDCVVFHMTDLPFGRGGSPLQNLIIRGFTETKITAIKVIEDIDAGPIYCKEVLDLSGKASEIFIRSSKIIRKMIRLIIEKQHIPYEQYGEVVHFKRRKPSDSNISELNNLSEIYDYIRMLDAEGYPPAFINMNKFKIEFFNSQIENNTITANVRIIQK
jgi:methionyl-tRNA formyltransferase